MQGTGTVASSEGSDRVVSVRRGATLCAMGGLEGARRMRRRSGQTAHRYSHDVPGNFARDVQAKSESTVAGLTRTRPARPKDVSSVGTSMAEPLFLTSKRTSAPAPVNNTHRRIQCPIPDGVDCRVTDQLLKTVRVPDSLGIALYVRLDLAPGMCRTQLVHHIGKHFSQINIVRDDVDAQAQLCSVEIAQVIKKRLHAGATFYKLGCSLRHLAPGIQRCEIRCGHLDGLRRTAHVVSKHSKQQVASL